MKHLISPLFEVSNPSETWLGIVIVGQRASYLKSRLDHVWFYKITSPWNNLKSVVLPHVWILWCEHSYNKNNTNVRYARCTLLCVREVVRCITVEKENILYVALQTAYLRTLQALMDTPGTAVILPVYKTTRIHAYQFILMLILSALISWCSVSMSQYSLTNHSDHMGTGSGQIRTSGVDVRLFRSLKLGVG